VSAPSPEPALDLSVCVVTRDGGQGVLDLLAALPAAAGKLSHEAVVVDNASRDGTPARIRGAAPAAVLIENPDNRGFARGCNQAAARARGRLLCFLNDDAIPEPRVLEGLGEALVEGVAAVGPRLEGRAGEPQQSAGPAPRLGSLLHRIQFLRATRMFRAAYRAWRHAPLPSERSEVERLGGAALLMRRRAPAWDEGFPFGLEDVDLSLRLGRQGALLYCPDLCVVHEGGRASADNQSFVLESFERGFARYLRLHDPRPWAGGLYKLLVTLDGPLRTLRAAWAALRRPGGTPRGDLARARLRAELEFYLGGGLLRFWRA
jgi:GT2 family glycosyltransferase